LPNRPSINFDAEPFKEHRQQARQIADRFHIPKNFRETIERQLGRYELP
jgi:hypothetical protein